MGDVSETAALEIALKEHNTQLQDFIKKANEEIKVAGSNSVETKAALEKLSLEAKEIVDRLVGVEQKIAHKPNGETQIVKSIGQMFTESEEYKAAAPYIGSHGIIQTVKIGSIHKAAIVNATGLNQPLVPTDRLAGLNMPALQRLTVRDLLPVGRTTSNMIQYAKENVFTNAAGPQYEASPELFEGVAKPESSLTFTIANEPVATLAHWIPASRQVLADAPMLQDYINTRLRYGLKLEEEDELLNGDGTGGQLNGLRKSGNFTAYNQGATGDTKIDTLRRALLQVSLSFYDPTGIVMHPSDWAAIELLKDTLGRYIVGDPQSTMTPSLWGKPVVATPSIPIGQFLVGAFAQGAQIWDREDATIRVSDQHENFFIKNMVAILAEERLALAVYRAAAFVGGAY